MTRTARLCLPCDLVPAVLLDKAFQQISIKSYFQRLKTKTITTKNQKPHLKNLLCTKPCDILHSGQFLHQPLNEHIWALWDVDFVWILWALWNIYGFKAYKFSKNVHLVQEHIGDPHILNNDIQLEWEVNLKLPQLFSTHTPPCFCVLREALLEHWTMQAWRSVSARYWHR